MSNIIDDEFLYAHMPKAERIMLDRIPPENELCHLFSRRFNRKMKALLKYEQRTPAMRRFVQQIKMAVVIFLVVLSMSFGVVMSVEAYRIRFFEFITKVWEELTSIVIHSEDLADHDTLISIDPSYVPEDYNLLEKQNSKYMNFIVYGNENGSEIYYSQKLATQSEFIFDTENAETDTIDVGKQTVNVLINKNTVQLYWHDEFYVFSLIGSVDKIELVKMAESIIKN